MSGAGLGAGAGREAESHGASQAGTGHEAGVNGDSGSGRGVPEGLREWVEFAAPQLGVDATEIPLGALLGMTGIVAHGVVRPAAPVSAYILGLAVGRGVIESNEAGDALLRGLVTEWQAGLRDELQAHSQDQVQDELEDESDA